MEYSVTFFERLLSIGQNRCNIESSLLAVSDKKICYSTMLSGSSIAREGAVGAAAPDYKL